MNFWKDVGQVFKVFILAAALGACLAYAQHVTYQAYGREQGLDNLVTTAVTEDKDGFLWVGTDAGLFRYDGSRFEFIGHESGLPEGDISPMIRASDGTLWVGTAQGLFHGGSDGFHRAGGVKLRLGMGSSTQLVEWKSGELLVVATGHIYVVHKLNASDGADWTVEDSANLFPGIPADLRINGIRPQGNVLWLGCGEAICRWQNSTLTEYGQAQGLPLQSYYGLRVSRDGSVWARSSHGLWQMDREGRWHDQSHSAGLSGLNSRFPLMAEDTEGNPVLVAGSSIATLTPRGWVQLSQKDGLPEAEITTTYFARGSLWLGTQGAGLIRLKGFGRWKNYTHKEGLPSNTVWQMSEDSGGNLLAATNAGVARKQTSSEAFSSVASVQQKPCVTYGLALDASDRIWSTCESAVYRFDAKTHERVRYVLPDVALYLQLAAGKMWIGTAKGLFTVGLDDGAALAEPVQEFVGQRIGQLLADGNGGLWIAASNGVFHFHKGAQHPTEIVSGKKYAVGFALAVGKDGALWFASRESGVYRAQLNGDRAESITQLGRPLLHSRQVYSLLVDRRGWVWCGGDAGFDVNRNGRWAQLNSTAGLITDDPNNGALLEAHDGSIWIGTSQGASRLLSPEGEIHTAKHNVSLLAVTIEGRDLALENQIDVPAGGGMVKVHLGASAHEEEPDVRLMYRIPGVLNHWEEVQQNYISLPQSIPQKAQIEYALLHEDQTMASPIQRVLVLIHPAWWRSDAALAGYALLLLALLAAGWKMRERRLKMRQLILEEIVASRTAEVEEKNRALEQARVKLLFEATHDSMTGLMNRSAVMRSLNKEVERCRREDKMLAVAILDLDHFKHINDTYGHAAGDVVLVEVSRRMSVLLRSYDVLGRFGGEEFVIAFPEIDQQSAGLRLDEIRARIAETMFNIDVALIPVTASIGYAHWQLNDSVAAMLKRADEALYKAKHDGRNRICAADYAYNNQPTSNTQSDRASG